MGVDGSGWEWMGVDGSGWEWVGVGGSGWEWMGVVDGSGWEWMGVVDGSGWEHKSAKSLYFKDSFIFQSTVCNFQSIKTPVELNILLSKFFCYITWFVISTD